MAGRGRLSVDGWALLIEEVLKMESVEIIALYAEIIRQALPFTIIFWMGEMIVTTFLRAAFGGKLSFKL